MKEFFRGQFDYIFFFYGFSFLLMGFVCFTLSSDKLRKFPWITLGLFGISHGINEWLALTNIIEGRRWSIAAIELAFLVLSYLCLFEFSREGLSRIKGITLSRWTYLPLLFLLPLGHKYGIDGWSAMARYSLGFFSAYAASRIILEFSKQEKAGKSSLIALSFIFGLYAVATGLIVPKIPLVPASLLNNDTFFDASGIPIQFLRGILALSAALSVWFYSAVPSEIKYKPEYSIRFVPTKMLIALTLISILGAGWLFTNYLDYYAGIQTIKRNKSNAASQFNGLIDELTRLSRATVSLSRSWEINDYLSSPTPQNVERAELILNNYKARYGAMNCALLDMRGLAVLSVENEKSNIQTGKSYETMPYFREALLGDNGYFFQLGPVYNKRIYYVSYPVKKREGTNAGVVVIEKRIFAEPLFQFRLFSISLTLTICVIALIFFIALKKRESFIVFIEKAISELEELDKMKSFFISAVSHELRTPLTSIRNAAVILKKGGPSKRPLDEQEDEMIDIILDNVDRQTRMVSDLLDVSKIEAGVMRVFPVACAITGLIKDAVASLRTLAEKKQIDIRLALKAPEAIAYADPELVRRILNNLIVNAINFTRDNGTITVATEDALHEIKVTVSDTGIGIAPADQERLFSMFCRLSAEEDRPDKGCGLGLAITKGLVEAQGGKIWVDSKVNQGSSFYFTLPKINPRP